MTQALAKAQTQGTKSFLQGITGQKTTHTPFWFMRQAGRYLPEYLETRANAGSFLDLCFSPDLATEVTLQPLRRFDMDAAILFADILIIPHGLGQTVSFKPGVGPLLESFQPETLSFENLHKVSAPIYNTVKQLSETLPADKALIGFAGAPWTVATYMIEGGSSKEFVTIRKMMYQDPKTLEHLIDVLIEATVQYLSHQIDAGAEAVQLFDSWAGILPKDMFEKWVIAPNAQIVAQLRKAYPDIPVIGFPKGAGLLYRDYVEKTGVTAVSLDHTIPLTWAAEHIQSVCPVQGCLDPMALFAGGDVMLDQAKKIVDTFSARDGFVFNLGHGIYKETPPEHVLALSRFLKTT